MDEIDLTGVAPLRRSETKRRIEAVRAYLAIKKPKAEDRKKSALDLGIGTQQFMNLVRAWRVHGSAVAIAKAGARAGAARRPRRRGLPPASRSAAEQALRSLPVSATHREAIAAVHAACRRRRTRVPSDSMVSYLRLRLTQAGEIALGTAGIAIGRAIAALPLLDGGSLRLPEVVIAADTATGQVLDLAMISDGKAPAGFAKALLSESSDGLAITVGAEDEDLVSAQPDVNIVTGFAAGRLLAKTIGRGIGGVRLSYGPLASTDPGRALRAKADEPLAPADVAAVLAQAVLSHNSARPGFRSTTHRLGAAAEAFASPAKGLNNDHQGRRRQQ